MKKTPSERQFEEYLRSVGHAEWDYEKPFPAKKHRLDYRLPFNGSQWFFDVKEFTTEPPGPGFSAFNPYLPIRSKVSGSWKQFQDYREYSCSLVLANPHNSFVFAEPEVIFGVMLGNLGFSIPLTPHGPSPTITNTFGPHGSMIDYQRQQSRNRHFAAIIFLMGYPARRNELMIRLDEAQVQEGRQWTLEEYFEAIERVGATCTMPESIRCCRVCENPFADKPLTPDLFRGPFDERYVYDGQRIKPVYIGDERQRMEDGMEKFRLNRSIFQTVWGDTFSRKRRS